MVKKESKTKAPEIIMEYDFNEKVSEEKKEDSPPEVVMSEEKKKDVEKVKVEKKKRVLKSKDAEKKEYLKKQIEAPVDDAIQELLDSEKTFLENILRKAKKSPFSAFYPFPKNISMLSIGKKEVVVLIVRHHWTGLLPRVLLSAFALLFPFLISYSVPSWFEGAVGSTFFVIGLFLFFMMVSVSILVDGFLKWFFQMNVITTKRIIDVDFVSIMTHRVSETTFDQVQDVSHSPAGPLASFFDYGHLYVQTAAAKSEFEFHNIPRPRDVQDTILDLRELRRKKLAKGE